MEEQSSVTNKGEVRVGVEWGWATASVAQLGWGIRAYRKGYAGDGRFMPFKAFAVASLFVGAATTAAVSALKASGINKVALSS